MAKLTILNFIAHSSLTYLHKTFKTTRIMRLNKQEKEVLMELLDVMTDRCPQLSIDKFTTYQYRMIMWNMFKKLRLEIKGY